MTYKNVWTEARKGLQTALFNGHRLEVERKFLPDEGRIGYKVRVDGREVASATSQSSAQHKAINVAQGRRATERPETQMALAFQEAAKRQEVLPPIPKPAPFVSEPTETVDTPCCGENRAHPDYPLPRRLERVNWPQDAKPGEVPVVMDAHVVDMPPKRPKQRHVRPGPGEIRNHRGIHGWRLSWEREPLVPIYRNAAYPGDWISPYRATAVNPLATEQAIEGLARNGLLNRMIISRKLHLVRVEDVEAIDGKLNATGTDFYRRLRAQAVPGEGRADSVADLGGGVEPSTPDHDVSTPDTGSRAANLHAVLEREETDMSVSREVAKQFTDVQRHNAVYEPPLGGGTPERPAHYQATINGNPVEVFDVLEAFGLDEDAYIAQAVQYILRSPKKGGVEDLEKAVAFIQRRIKKLKGA